MRGNEHDSRNDVGTASTTNETGQPVRRAPSLHRLARLEAPLRAPRSVLSRSAQSVRSSGRSPVRLAADGPRSLPPRRRITMRATIASTAPISSQTHPASPTATSTRRDPRISWDTWRHGTPITPGASSNQWRRICSADGATTCAPATETGRSRAATHERRSPASVAEDRVECKLT